MSKHDAPFAPIAVVAAGCIMPGATSLGAFWQNVLSKRDLVTDVPATHWRVEDYYDADPKAPDKTYARRGAFLPEVPFDAAGFGVPPSVIPATDTSQLLALIVAQQVLEEAERGVKGPPDRSRVSVILGVTGAQELLGSLVSRLQRPVWERALREMGLGEDEVQEACKRIAAHYVPWQEASFPGLLGNVVAGRIANRLDLGGSNYITDAACASSLAALRAAVDELHLGHSDMVISGGVDTLNDVFMYMCFSKTPALSMTGDCRPFSDEADGTLLGEGIGMVALKRLADAERDGDHLYGVIRGLGTSSDGRAKSVYAPIPEGQAKALRRAYESAGYGPETVDLVEAHGTATKAGDLAELTGLKLVFSGRREDTQWCAVGSVKSQIGHTKAAAGVAGLLKVLLALHHRVIPPTIKVKRPAPAGEFDSSPFYVAIEPRPWVRRPTNPRRASVSSFGFGGSNFHVTLEEYEGDAPRPPRMNAWPAELLVCCADDDAGLTAALEALRGEDLLTAAKRTQLAYRKGAKRRIALLVSREPGPDGTSTTDLDKVLHNALAAVKKGAPVARGGVWFTPDAEPGKVAFLFPGQGSQYLDMGKGLAMSLAPAQDAWDAADSVFPEEDRLSFVVYPRPVFEEGGRKRQEERLVRTEWAQPGIGAVSVATLAVLRAVGLAPDVTGGHSFGELTALHAAGALSLPDLLRAARRRGELMAEAAAAPGAMVAVQSGPDAVTPHLAGDPALGEVVIANYNTPEQTVIAGPTAAVEAAQARLEAAGLRATRLSVATAFHSSVVAPAGAAFSTWLHELSFTEPTLPVWSNATGAPYAPGVDVAAALGDHLRSAVRFVEEVRGMYQAGVRTFVEVGPGAVLTGLVTRCLTGEGFDPKQVHAFATDNKAKDQLASLLAALGHAAALGLPADFAPLWADRWIPAEPPKPKLAVPLLGTNYGKPWPRVDQVAVPPNPPRAKAPAPSPAAKAETKAEPKLESAPKLATPPVAVPASVPSPAPVAAVAPVAAPAPIVAPVAAPLPAAPRAPEPAMSRPSAPSPWLAAFVESQRSATEVHTLFQRTLTDAHLAFLQAHENTTRALLGLAGSPVNEAAWAAPTLPAPGLAAPAHLSAHAGPVHAGPVHTAPVPTAPLQHLPVQAAPVAPVPVVSVQTAPVAAPASPPRAAAPVASTPAPVTHVSRVSPPAAGAGIPLLLAVVAEKTGYPTEMLDLDMNLEADLGIDSIKRVEILSAVRERAPQLPELDAETLGTLRTLRQIVDAVGLQDGAPVGAGAAGRPAASAQPGTAQVAEAPAGGPGIPLLLAVVAEKTGYPTEMLDLDMNLEADLGIDSIKRVEILSAVRERAPQLPELDAETLGTLRTLRQIVEAVGLTGGNTAVTPAPVSHVSDVSGAPAGPGIPLLLAVVAEKTGYPTEMLDLDMNLEADLGIDSIKRVEILSAVRERAPQLPELDAETLGTLRTLRQIVDAVGLTGGNTAATPAPVSHGSAVSAAPAGPGIPLLLAVVAEKTGYPTEMLDLDMNLEADLGIDSIKRVEILSAVRERAPQLPELDAETLGTLRTLRQIVDAVGLTGGAAAPAPTPTLPVAAAAPPAPVKGSPAVPSRREPVADGIGRFEVVVVPAGDQGPASPLPVAVVGGGEAGPRLVTELRQRGVDAVTQELGALDRSRLVVFLGGLTPPADLAGAEALALDAFRAARGARLDTHGGFVTVTALGGQFALGNLPLPPSLDAARGLAATGALSGLVKTVALEHPGARCRAIDLADGGRLDQLADELGRLGPVEVGLAGSSRLTLLPAAAPEALDVSKLALTAGDVVVVSGGARGVTAACVVELVRTVPVRVVLLGRSRIDAPEALAVAAATDEAALKRAVFGTEPGLTPPQLGKRVAAILAAREARATVAAVEAAGGAAWYLPCDVSDAASVAGALAQVRQAWGPIAGLVHGAGVIADKRLLEKTEAQVQQVWSTKIAGVDALFRATDGDPLKVVCLFSSVAGRVGNIGQCDYAMANEALNKLAALEAARRPTAVVKAIGWGPWAGGMVNPALAKQFAARGVLLIPLERGARLFVEELTGWRKAATEVVVGGAPGPLWSDLSASDAPKGAVVNVGGPPVLAAAQGGGLASKAGQRAAVEPKAPRVVRRAIRAGDFPFLKDHVVDELPVFPVVLALEWFVELARELAGQPGAVTVRDLRVLKGIVLKGFDGAGDEFELVASEVAPSRWDMELRGADGTRHYRAIAELGGARPEAPKAPDDTVTTRYPLTPPEIYQRYLFHGPDFQLIRGVRGISEGGMEAELSLTRDMGWTTAPAGGWATEVATFDGGLQLAALWTRHHTRAGALPMGIARYTSYGAPAPGPVRCVLRGRKAGASNTVADLAYVDSEGRVFAEMTGVETYALPGGDYPRLRAISAK